MIEVEHLVKRYGEIVAVDDVSFRIEKGEILGFLGPNGAGKTTTMRMITGFVPMTSGRVRVGGVDLAQDPRGVKRQIGYLPEGNPLYPEMRLREYLDFRARLKGLGAARRRERIEQVLGACFIKDMADRIVGQLSKGYRQRLGIADALVADPPVLIMDEPTVGLDPHQIRDVRSLIRGLAQQHTVVLSTHILPEVEMVCDRVIIISDGRLVAQAHLDELKAQGRTLEELFIETTLRAHRGGHTVVNVQGGTRPPSAQGSEFPGPQTPAPDHSRDRGRPPALAT